MNRDEWFIASTGMNDSLAERFIEWAEANQLVNAQE